MDTIDSITPDQYHQRIDQYLMQALVALSQEGYERQTFITNIMQAQACLFALEQSINLQCLPGSKLLLVIYRSSQHLLRHVAMSYDYMALQSLKGSWEKLLLSKEVLL